MFVAIESESISRPLLSIYLFERVNQGWRRTSVSENRDATSTFIMPLSSERTSRGRLSQSSSDGFPFDWIYSENSFGRPYSSWPSTGLLHGVLPAKRTNNTAPQDQISLISAE